MSLVCNVMKAVQYIMCIQNGIGSFPDPPSMCLYILKELNAAVGAVWLARLHMYVQYMYVYL